MKTHSFFLACLLGLLHTAHAQTEKGTLAIGINAAKGIWRTEQSDVASGKITPSISYFLRKNVLIGLSVPLESGKTSYARAGLTGDLSRLNSSSIGLALIARRYFLDGRVKPFVHLDGGYT
ncbi:hypothetical protein ACAW74_07940 [Fibrella sp. WM1]|uniref:hypothetical protein n=1 Tax=Fibrella musci TaxID=3242485 RepID=UPI003522F983